MGTLIIFVIAFLIGVCVISNVIYNVVEDNREVFTPLGLSTKLTYTLMIGEQVENLKMFVFGLVNRYILNPGMFTKSKKVEENNEPKD